MENTKTNNIDKIKKDTEEKKMDEKKKDEKKKDDKKVDDKRIDKNPYYLLQGYMYQNVNYII